MSVLTAKYIRTLSENISELEGGAKGFITIVETCNENELTFTIVGTALIDEALTTLLKKYFLKGSTAKNILSHNGALGNLFKKAQIAYVTGLIPKSVFKNIEIIANIRNLFGHKGLRKSFEDKNIEKLCDQLKQIKQYDSFIIEQYSKRDATKLKPSDLRIRNYSIFRDAVFAILLYLNDRKSKITKLQYTE